MAHRGLRALLAAAASCAVTGAASAQDLRPGGQSLSFTLNERLDVSHNGLESGNWSVTSVTGLSSAYLTETRTQRLEFSADLSLRAGLEEGREDAVLTPRLAFSYAREGARSALTFNLRASRQEVEYLDLFALIGDDGMLIDVEDLTDLEGEGLRTDRSLSLSYTLGTEGPIQLGTAVRLSDVEYDQVPADGDLQDSGSAAVDVDLSLRTGPADRLSVGAGWSAVDAESGPGRRETRSVSLGYTIDRPRGALTADVSFSDTPDGERYGFSVGRALSFPRGALEASLGVTREASGNTTITGHVELTREFRLGQFGLTADREVQTGTEGEIVITRLSADYGRSLTPRLSVDVGMDWLRVGDTGADTVTEIADVEASLGYALSQDWALDTGARHRWQSETGEDTTRESTLFVELRRSFGYRLR